FIYFLSLFVNYFHDFDVVLNTYSLNYFLFINIILLGMQFFLDSSQEQNIEYNWYLNLAVVSVILQLLSSYFSLIKRATYFSYVGFYLLIPEIIMNSRK